MLHSVCDFLWKHTRSNFDQCTYVYQSVEWQDNSAFTTPRQFLWKAWPWITDADNGLADRIWFMYQKKVERHLEKMAELSEQLFPWTRWTSCLSKFLWSTILMKLLSICEVQVPEKHFSSSLSCWRMSHYHRVLLEPGLTRKLIIETE